MRVPLLLADAKLPPVVQSDDLDAQLLGNSIHALAMGRSPQPAQTSLEGLAQTTD